MPPIVSPEDWKARRDELLVKEKRLTKELDALAAERRRLPMVPFDASKYTFIDQNGKKVKLIDLFDGKSQVRVDSGSFPTELCSLSC